VPARETILDLSVRPLVLFEDGDSDSTIRQYLRGYGTGNSSSDNGDEVLSVL
jgi:hypothetical protein